jgi:hypothetical protein
MKLFPDPVKSSQKNFLEQNVREEEGRSPYDIVH